MALAGKPRSILKVRVLGLFLYFDSPMTRGKLLFPSLKQRLMLLAITVNSQYSNMKNSLLRQQIEI